nr:serine hydrolase [Bifidobacterium breve]
MPRSVSSSSYPHEYSRHASHAAKPHRPHPQPCKPRQLRLDWQALLRFFQNLSERLPQRHHGKFKILKGSVYTRRRIVVGCLGVLLLVELFQLFWPSDKFFPLATLDGHAVGGQSSQQAAETLNAATLKRTVKLTDKTTGTTVSLTAKQAGITVDYTDRAKAAAKHSVVKRIVPFSWLFVHSTTSDSLPDALGTSDKQAHEDMRNASVQGTKGELKIVSAAPGYTFTSADIRSAAGSSFSSSATGDLAAATIEMGIVSPTVSDDTAEQLLDTLNKALSKDVTFTYEDGTWTVPAKKIINTVSTTVNAQDNTKLDVTISESKLMRQLKSKGIALKVAKKAAGAGVVPATIAVKGNAYQVIDASATAASLSGMLASGQNAPVAVSTKDFSNVELYEGLPASGTIEEKLQQLFGDADYEVAVYDLKTGKSKIQIDADTAMVSASTYKLFIAYSMIHAVETGQVTWDSALNGMTLSSCMATMIINSDNSCPEAWLDRYGFSTVTQQAHDIGAANTNFVPYDMTTTANDLATVLKGFYSNSIASPDSTDQLFSLMETQVYREGIPAGIGSDGVVQDKVGFMDGLLHDAAIVRSDKGDYAMVIMTDGSSWNKIAQASLLIYESL